MGDRQVLMKVPRILLQEKCLVGTKILKKETWHGTLGEKRDSWEILRQKEISGG